jgi:hypothetical protein
MSHPLVEINLKSEAMNSFTFKAESKAAVTMQR